jgi:hypothetical protein
LGEGWSVRIATAKHNAPGLMKNRKVILHDGADMGVTEEPASAYQKPHEQE